MRATNATAPQAPGSAAKLVPFIRDLDIAQRAADSMQRAIDSSHAAGKIAGERMGYAAGYASGWRWGFVCGITAVPAVVVVAGVLYRALLARGWFA